MFFPHNSRVYVRCFVLVCLFMIGVSLWSQTSAPALSNDEPFSFIGMKLDELISRFGSPQAVYAARGKDLWQDDVIFMYNEREFYVFRDRVWQIGLKSFYDMKVGDAKAVAMLILGGDVHDYEDHLIYHFADVAWPVSLRLNFNAGRISAIFLYRSDY